MSKGDRGINNEDGDGDGDSNFSTRRADSGEISLDTIFSILNHRRRRLILRFCTQFSEETSTFADLVEYVHEWESELGKSPERESIETALWHNHLPKLVEANIVEHDSSTESVRYLGSNRLERFMDVAIEERIIP